MTEPKKPEVTDYPLLRDFFLSSTRYDPPISSLILSASDEIRSLYLQHWMWRRQFGYLLHYPIPMQNFFKVADLACGTGYRFPLCALNSYVDSYLRIWLFDLAKQYPSACLDGYDISTAQFPHRNWLPTNTDLTSLDILKPIPEHLRGTYDVVHLGMLVLVIEKDDPIPLLENVLTLLSTFPFAQNIATWSRLQAYLR